MMMERSLKILMSGGLAVLCALIAIGNINDPELNLSFVQHVLSMDTVAGPIAVHGVRSPFVWEIGFWSIVAGEVLTAAFLPGERSSSCGPAHPRREFFMRPSVLSTPELAPRS